MVQVLITNPYELIKIRQQTVVGQPITETIRELGLRGLTKVRRMHGELRIHSIAEYR